MIIHKNEYHNFILTTINYFYIYVWVAQLECHPTHQKVKSLIAGGGMYKRQLISLSLSLSLSLSDQ